MTEQERIQAIVDQFIKEAGATTLAEYETILRTLRNKGLHGSAQMAMTALELVLSNILIKSRDISFLIE